MTVWPACTFKSGFWCLIQLFDCIRFNEHITINYHSDSKCPFKKNLLSKHWPQIVSLMKKKTFTKFLHVFQKSVQASWLAIAFFCLTLLAFTPSELFAQAFSTAGPEVTAACVRTRRRKTTAAAARRVATARRSLSSSASSVACSSSPSSSSSSSSSASVKLPNKASTG